MKLANPTMIAVSNPRWNVVAPLSVSMAGATVFTSMKLMVSERNRAWIMKER
jgi:hypothetical protein